LQINDELDVHHGLLQELDTDIDRTDSRLRKARRKLDVVAKGVKENGALVGHLILYCVLGLIVYSRFCGHDWRPDIHPADPHYQV